jgi:hypothetical protein
MNVRYERRAGGELFTDDGERILDFLSGYRVTMSATTIRTSCAQCRVNWSGAVRR